MTRVVVTGAGCVSPFGLTPDALWDGLVSGRSAVRTVARFTAGGLPVTTGGEAPLEALDRERDLAMSRRPIVDALDSARARGASIVGEVVGFGASQDAFDLNRPPPEGAGAELCMRRALADAGLAADRIAAVNAHGTGTRAGDPAEAAALRRVIGDP